jgi:hypothetical protein
MTRHRRFVVGFVLAALIAACGGDDGGGDDVTLEEVEPIVAVAPCDLLDSGTAAELAGAEVTEPEEVLEDDGTTSCSFGFADDEVAETAGSDIAALLEIGPGDEDDVPGGSLARSLDMGDASAVEEEEDKVTVVYVVQTVVVIVEVAPGSGEVTPEMVDDVVEFTESTEPAVTEAVTGEPFVPDETTTTEFVDDPAEGDVEIEVDGDAETLSFDRPGGDAIATFEGEAGGVVFIRFPAATYADPDAGTCLRVTLVTPDDFTLNAICVDPEGASFFERSELELTGVYQLVLEGDATQTGSVDILVTSATDGQADIEVDGATETAAVEQPGALFALDFDLGAGDGFFVAFPRVVYDDTDAGLCIRATIVDPDGFTLNAICVNEDGSTFMDQQPVETAGTYQVIIDGDSFQTGEVDVQITSTD